MIEIHQKATTKPTPIIEMLDAKTSSSSTINEEQPVIEPPKRSVRAKRRTDDEVRKIIR
jgi:hypothetical protein